MILTALIILTVGTVTVEAHASFDWIPFTKDNNSNNKVVVEGENNEHAARMPCGGGWFKLYYNTGHFEIFANNKGNLFCAEAGKKNWHGGERYDFSFPQQECHDGFVNFHVHKTDSEFVLSVGGNEIFRHEFNSQSGKCLQDISSITTYVYDSRDLLFMLGISRWSPFSKGNVVELTGDVMNHHSARMPCSGGWFKLYYNTGHFEIFANNKGNLFCKKAGDQDWHGGAVYDFSFPQQPCSNDFVQFDVVKSSQSFGVYVQGVEIYHHAFGGDSGDCLHDIDEIKTHVYDSRPMTFYLRPHFS